MKQNKTKRLTLRKSDAKHGLRHVLRPPPRSAIASRSTPAPRSTYIIYYVNIYIMYTYTVNIILLTLSTQSEELQVSSWSSAITSSRAVSQLSSRHKLLGPIEQCPRCMTTRRPSACQARNGPPILRPRFRELAWEDSTAHLPAIFFTILGSIGDFEALWG